MLSRDTAFGKRIPENPYNYDSHDATYLYEGESIISDGPRQSRFSCLVSVHVLYKILYGKFYTELHAYRSHSLIRY